MYYFCIPTPECLKAAFFCAFFFFFFCEALFYLSKLLARAIRTSLKYVALKNAMEVVRLWHFSRKSVLKEFELAED